MTETWLPVVGFEEFIEVSDHGRLRSLDRVIVVSSSRCSEPYQYVHKGRLLKQSRNDSRGGYMYITLCGGGRVRSNVKVHHIVLEAFVGPRPLGTEGCHGNDIPDDNRLTNLRWDTQEANASDARANGRNHNSNKTHCPKGHEYTPENTAILKNPAGARRCRTCTRERYVVKGRSKTHCPKGHEYTPENTVRYGNGGRRCRICERSRKRSERRCAA